jgi:enoyl-CoA hydratase/carnithine racemase
MSEHVLVEKSGTIQIVRLNRPEKKNALTRAMYRALADALISGDADPAIRCHVLLGQPGAFSAGNDLADFMAVAEGADGGTEVFDFLKALALSEKPVVSGVDGIAVGIGTTIHFHCDLTFATPQTHFHTPFLDLGIVPEAASTLLAPALLGRQGAFALLCMGDRLSAADAKAAGFIHDVVEADALEGKVHEAAARIAAKPPQSLRLSRNLMRPPRAEIVARIEEEGRLFRERLKSDEAKAALAAFLNRKK